MLLVCAAVFAQNATIFEDRKLLLLIFLLTQEICPLFLKIDQVTGLSN